MAEQKKISRRKFMYAGAGAVVVAGAAAAAYYATMPAGPQTTMTTSATTVAPPATTMTTAKPTPVTINLWHYELTPNRVAGYQWLCDQFHDKFPQWTVVQNAVAAGEIATKTMASARTGNQDLQQTDIYRTLAYQHEDLLQTLDDIFDEQDKKWRIKKGGQTGLYKGHRWAMPDADDPCIFHYMMDKLSTAGLNAAPKTFDEMNSVLPKLVQPNNKLWAYACPTVTSLCTDYQFWMVALMNGAELFDKDGNVTFNTPEVINAMKEYKVLYANGPPDQDGYDWAEIEIAFVAPTFAMLQYWPAMLYRFNERNQTFWGADLPPQGPDAKGDPRVMGALYEFPVFKDALKLPGHYEAVMEFLNFQNDPQMSSRWLNRLEPGWISPCTEEGMKYYPPLDWTFNNDKCEMGGVSFTDIVSRFKGIMAGYAKCGQYLEMIGMHYPELTDSMIAISGVMGQDTLSKVVQRLLVQKKSPEEAAAWGQKQIEDIVAGLTS